MHFFDSCSKFIKNKNQTFNHLFEYKVEFFGDSENSNYGIFARSEAIQHQVRNTELEIETNKYQDTRAYYVFSPAFAFYLWVSFTHCIFTLFYFLLVGIFCCFLRFHYKKFLGEKEKCIKYFK